MDARESPSDRKAVPIIGDSSAGDSPDFEELLAKTPACVIGEYPTGFPKPLAHTHTGEEKKRTTVGLVSNSFCFEWSVFSTVFLARSNNLADTKEREENTKNVLQNHKLSKK